MFILGFQTPSTPPPQPSASSERGVRLGQELESAVAEGQQLSVWREKGDEVWTRTGEVSGGEAEEVGGRELGPC